MTDSVLSAMTFNRTDAITIEGWKELKKINESTVEINQYINLDDTAVRQVVAITILGGSTGDIYSIGVQKGVTYSNFSYKQQSTDTATNIAQNLANCIDKSETLEVATSGDIVVVTVYESGQEVTITNDQSTQPSNLVITETVAADGTGNVVLLLSKTRLTYSTNFNGNPQIEAEIEWHFNDDITPITSSNRGITIHPNSLGELQSAVL